MKEISSMPRPIYDTNIQVMNFIFRFFHNSYV